ncbi:N-alpha-acetyltransferase 50 [Dimargaris cristalligena]|uniref:Acyl-CoA N-acyltransferase n=1 Tax=Dimargaris cristalligena TaxID=215637 RepID=A0A4Q0A0C5_9FUNG|nr:N-alpha-acetyltransferase 50 [Dimargaris cristalligena]RKP38560.1 acyl-CoA N-acyltransferase [Dimargaris cristalligena]|eukprot:RKP38560.1 acyl-CoA N-acyltransferase [Dimargaris cristalligena]
MLSDAPNSSVQLVDITPDLLPQVKRLNGVLFPVQYSPSFYKLLLTVGEYAKLAYFNRVCVGTVGCKLEPIAEDPESDHQLYIMTLGVLAPYRRLGIGRVLLEHILQAAHTANYRDHGPVIKRVRLHVQVSNEDAMAFYQRQGFLMVETVPDYYTRISPADAYILEKQLLGPSD